MALWGGEERTGRENATTGIGSSRVAICLHVKSRLIVKSRRDPICVHPRSDIVFGGGTGCAVPHFSFSARTQSLMETRRVPASRFLRHPIFRHMYTGGGREGE